jgi:hypothetical protein
MKFLSQINVNTEYTLPMVDGTNGQVLSTDGNGVAYWGTISAGSLTLDGLSDVIITSPSSDQMLRYGLRQGDTVPVWHNFTPNFLTPSSSINALNDVVITTAAAGQILQYNGSNWVNWTPNFLTAEADTLATVTARGATTNGNIVVNGEISLPSFIRLTNAGVDNAFISESWGINLNGIGTHPVQVRGASFSVGYSLGGGTSYGSGNLFVSNKIGINTTAPTKLLDVVGSGIVASFGSAFTQGSFAGIHFGYSETQFGNDNYKKSAIVFERTDNHGQGGNASGKIHFLLNNIGSGSATSLAHSVMVIDTNSTATQGSARVGIGTTSPNSTLDVNGAANATSFSSTALLITNADTSGSLQPDQGDPANKIYSFRWQGNEGGYIDTDNKITFSGFKTPAGTSSQFLKANGTVDSNTYITSTSLNGYATESWVNLNYYNRDQIDDFFGGAEEITGYNKPNWDAAYNDKINSASFSTTTGVLTLTQQDTGTVTVDLDGRYITSYVDTVTSVGIVDDLSTGDIVLKGSGATTIIKSGGTITITSTDTDTTYSAGTGLTLTGTTFSVTSGTYAAASHNHDDRYYTETESDSRFFFAQSSQLANTNLNNLTTRGVYYSADQYGTNTNIPFANYFTMINLTNDIGRQAQLWFGDTPGSAYWRARQGDSTGWHAWEKLITSNNIGSQSVNFATSSGNSSTTDQTNFTALSINNSPVATEEFVASQGYITGSYLPLSGGTVTGTVTANRFSGRNTLVLNNYTTVNPASNVFLYSQPNDRDAWIFLDSADTGSNWGIYHRQIDSAVGDIPANSLGFVGGGASALQAYISLANGDAYFRGNLVIGGTFTEQSSIRYKENVKSIPSVSQKMQHLDAVSYNKIGSNQEEIGLIAEDVAELFPEVVKYDNEGRPDGVNYSRLSVILLKAVQELTERVNKLENK